MFLREIQIDNECINIIIVVSIFKNLMMIYKINFINLLLNIYYENIMIFFFLNV